VQFFHLCLLFDQGCVVLYLLFVFDLLRREAKQLAHYFEKPLASVNSVRLDVSDSV